MLPSVLACVVLVLSACSGSRTAHGGAIKTADKRQKAPDFTLRDAEGRTVQLSDYRGKVVLLNFWATGCAPCRAEIPWFIDFEKEYKDRGFAVLGVSMDDEGWEVVRPYIERMRVNYRVLMGDSMVSDLYGGVEAVPTSFMIDREGRIARMHVGLASRSEYQDDIDKLLDESRAGGGSAAGVAGGAE